MIKYYVRTTGERKYDYSPLKYTELIDKEHKPIDSFIEQLIIISEEDAVLLEDDLILCKDFQKKIEEVIAQYPNDIINFFTMPEKYFTTHYSDKFVYNQCTYYPKGVAKEIAETMKNVRKVLISRQYDEIQSKALNQLGMRHLVYRPCLVQHVDGVSLIQDKTRQLTKRETIYFVDYLEEAGIDYNDAFLRQNSDKLHQLYIKHMTNGGK